MDNFVDKLSLRYTAGEMIKANSEADTAQMQDLEEQVEAYEAVLQEMRKLNYKNTELTEKMYSLVDESIEKVRTLQLEASSGGANTELISREMSDAVTDTLNAALNNMDSGFAKTLSESIAQALAQPTEEIKQSAIATEGVKETVSKVNEQLELMALQSDDNAGKLDSLKADVDALKSGMLDAAKTDSYDGLKEDIDSLKESIASVKSAVESLETTGADNKELTETAQLGNEQVIANTEEIKTRLAELSAAGTDDDTKIQIANLTLDAGELKAQLTNLASDTTDVKNQLTNLASDTTEVKNQIEGLKNQLENEVTKATETPDTNSKFDDIAFAVEEVKEGLSGLASNNEEVKSQIAGFASGSDEIKSQISELASGNEEVKSQIASLSASAEDIKSQNYTLATNIDELKAQYIQAVANLDSISRALQEAKEAEASKEAGLSAEDLEAIKTYSQESKLAIEAFAQDSKASFEAYTQQNKAALDTISEDNKSAFGSIYNQVEEAKNAAIEAKNIAMQLQSAPQDSSSLSAEELKAPLIDILTGTEEVRTAVRNLKNANDDTKSTLKTSLDSAIYGLKQDNKEIVEFMQRMNANILAKPVDPDAERKEEEAKKRDEEQRQAFEERIKLAEDFMHKESVKVYRNVQAVINEKTDRQTDGLDGRVKESTSKIGQVKTIAIIAAGLSGVSLVLQVLSILGIL